MVLFFLLGMIEKIINKNMNTYQFKKKKKKEKGFTLIETLLIVFFVAFTFIGMYIMQNRASEDVMINKEEKYILTLFDQIDKSAYALGKYENISLEYLKENGYINKTNGFDLISVTAPTPTRLEATYNNIQNKECSVFVTNIVNINENHSAKINNIVISSKSNPQRITLECSAGNNEVVIIRENNVFGVALNTSLNGINNPMIGQNINNCPVGVCNTMTPVTPVPLTPITVTVNKPPVIIPGAITTPTFTPGTPMVQPPVVPPVVTPPLPPITTPPVIPPPVVTPPVVPPPLPPILPPPVVPPVSPPEPPIVTPTDPAGTSSLVGKMTCVNSATGQQQCQVVKYTVISATQLEYVLLNGIIPPIIIPLNASGFGQYDFSSSGQVNQCNTVNTYQISANGIQITGGCSYFSPWVN